jgi:hypothetical protein
MNGIFRRAKGSSLVETAAGIIFIIPVLFCLIDVAALVVVQTANDSLAKTCARAAADFPKGTGQALAAATNRFTLYQNSGVLRKVSLGFYDDPASNPVPGSLSPPIPQPNGVSGQETVVCVTTVNCVLPIPVPFGGPAQTQFVAYAVEPVVGQMP